MRPIFKILADGANITARIDQRLSSIKTTDEAGFKSDTCTIDLDDRDGLIELPRKGAQLEVYLGYEETGLSKIGVYTVDEISLSGFPEVLSISAKAADMAGEIKSQKTRYFDGITLGSLVKKLAGDNGLVGKASADLSTIQLGHVDQTQESDLHLLTRLAKQYGGVAKVTHGNLIVAKAGESKSVSGTSLVPIIINKHQVSGYHCSMTDRGKYAAVTAAYHDKATGKNVSVSTSAEKPAHILRHTYDNQQQAIEAARAKKDALDQGTSTVDVTLAIGNPNLFAESPLILIGFRSGITGVEWTATRVEHSFSKSAFTTQVNGEIK
ncbi:MAG: contractile injection system protein, VgrG/Pvc8 family [Methylobacter sp.]